MTDAYNNINAPSLVEYFRDLVHGALDQRQQNQDFLASTAVEFYLVHLLESFVLTHRVYPLPTEGFKEEPLAYLFLRAARLDSEARAPVLKHLGDFSLFITGFFPESVTRQLVDLNYYIQMGESAYGSLSQLLAQREALSEIYAELAERFLLYVDVLAEVSEKSHLSSDRDLLRLYEHWLQTGSKRSESLLSQAGIVPSQSISKRPH